MTGTVPKENDRLAKARAARPKPPKDETREQKLVRLAERRIPRAVKALSHIGNLAAYKPTPEQVEAIEGVLRRAVDAVCEKLKRSKPDAELFLLPK